MIQLGVKKAPNKELTTHDYAVIFTKKFIKQLAGNHFFSGPEDSLTPRLKVTLAQEFELYISRNKSVTAHQETADQVIEHSVAFIEETFRIKRIGGKKPSWAEILVQLKNHQWREL